MGSGILPSMWNGRHDYVLAEAQWQYSAKTDGESQNGHNKNDEIPFCAVGSQNRNGKNMAFIFIAFHPKVS